MVEKEVILTQAGLQKLEGELGYLKTVRRREIAERIKFARQFGDINENSEYEDAKNEQAFVEGRILTLEKILRNARLVEECDYDVTQVCIGSRVRLRNPESGEEVEYVLVGSTEADPGKNRISNESPVGKALLNSRVGDIVEVKVPVGILKYEIVSINPREG
jgi:transcription elongation factor GreA